MKKWNSTAMCVIFTHLPCVRTVTVTRHWKVCICLVFLDCSFHVSGQWQVTGKCAMCIRGGWKNKNFIFKLACKLPPFSWLFHFQKHKAHLCDPPGSASYGCHFSRKIYKEILKNTKENRYQFCFSHNF